MSLKVTKLPKSQVELEGELDATLFESYYPKALQKLGEHMEVDGFRKGKVPENVLASKIPEARILEEMAELAIHDEYPKMLEQEKIDAIGRPEVSITKLARKNPLGFKIKTATLPEIKIAKYKDIAKKVIAELKETEKEIEVTEREMEDTIMDIRKSRAPKVNMKNATPPDLPLSGEETTVPPDKGEDKGVELPEFTDEYVRALGPFENIEDFKEKLKLNIKLEKENQAKERKRIKIIEKIIEESEIDTPDILVEIELDKILYRMQADIAAMGLKFEDYLKHINKTIEDLQKEFRPDALKRANLALVLNEIAKTEKLVPDPEQVEREIAAILEQYKDADRERAAMHVENVLTNEKVFEFLENQ